MRKILNNKLLMMPLVIVLTISAAMFAFAPSGIKADPNKGLPFKAVKLCTPKLIQIAIQKIIKNALAGAASLIPFVGGAVASAIRSMPDDKIPVPCGCDNNLYDSAPTPMNVKDNPFDFLGEFTIPVLNIKLTQSTQKKLDEKLNKEVVPKWEEAEKQQAAMIKTGDPDGLDIFRNVYVEMRKGLADANALSYVDNFDEEFKKRFPNMSAHVEKMSDAERRMAGAWRQIMDAWMKGLNVAGRNFDEEQRIRNTLANVILKTYDDTAYDLGQTHILQFIGALAAHSNAVADRTMTELRGQVEMALTQMMAENEYDASARRNVTVMGKNAAACDMSGCGNHSFGF